VERVILPDSIILTSYLLSKTTWLVNGMRVYPDRMRRNLDLGGGLIFSGQVLLDLTAAGMLREEAYRLVQTHAMKTWNEDGNFRQAIENDPAVRACLGPSALAAAFSLDRQLRNVDRIFERVFQ
jgi:adenylosuccinate lyase